jgi:hypothetical protein
MILKHTKILPAFERLISEWWEPFGIDTITWVAASNIDDNFKFQDTKSVWSWVWDCRWLTSIDSWLFQFLIQNKYIKKWKGSIVVNGEKYQDNTPEYRVAIASLKTDKEITQRVIEKTMERFPTYIF